MTHEEFIEKFKAGMKALEQCESELKALEEKLKEA